MHHDERLGPLLDRLGLGMFRTTLDGRLLEANAPLLRILGLSSLQPGLDITRFYRRPADRARLVRTLSDQRQVNDFETALQRADGTEVIVLISEAAVHTADGEQVIDGLMQDVTERHRALEAARSQQAELEALIAGMNDVVLVLDRECRLLTVHPSAREILPRPAAEMAGHQVREVFPAEMAAEIERRAAEALEGGVAVRFEYSVGREEGETAWFSAVASPLPGQRVLWVARDITVRRSTRIELERTVSLLNATLESTTDGILVVDSAGRIASYNRKFVELWRMPREVLATRDDQQALKYVLSQLEEPARFLDKVTELYATPDAESHDLLRFRDGRRLERFSRPQRIGGQVVGRVWSFRDVTQRMLLQEQLQQAVKMEAVGRLAGGIAHDFNNLLTAILGAAELALEELDGSHPVRADVEEIRHSAGRAALLTRQLLAFSRRQVLRPEILNLNEVVTGMEKLITRLVGPGIATRYELAADLGTTRADRGQLEQVLMNLAVNARDAMPEGGALTISSANTALGERSPEGQRVVPGAYVRLTVRDTGIGMSETVRQHLFEPFFTTKERGKGTGLGLATVYGIIKQSDGYIWAGGSPGAGAEFIIYLPRVEAAAEPPPPPLAPVDIPHRAATLLVVEDEPSVRRLARRVLEQEGYTVLAAANGEEALDLAAQHCGPIHLLVTDLIMPGLSGTQLARRVGDQRPDCRVLFISGYSNDAISRQGALAPGASFLQKPFTRMELLQQVSRLLAGGPGILAS